MRRLLVTGGDGYFGQRLRQRLTGVFEILSTDKGDVDITDTEAVRKLVLDFKPELVVHAAALLVTDFCEKNPDVCWQVNVKGALNVGESCRDAGAKMVFFSTEQVFNGNQGPGPFRETDLPQPNTVYGKNKLEAETRLSQMLPQLWILRFAWTFGFPERNLPLSPNLFWEVVRAALRGERLNVPVNELRSLTYIYDIIDQFERVFDLPFGLYHVGSPNRMNRYDVACEILRLLRAEKRIPELLHADAEKYKDKPRDVRLDVAKITAQGFAFTETRQGLQRLIKEFGLA